tara:strand:+ start:526 stop:768 length:243 start_codon:yes stop_codon:yes gene_type:complete
MDKTKLALKRTQLARDRTILAMIRTSISLMLPGIAFIGFADKSKIFYPIGIASIITGIFFLILTIRFYIKHNNGLSIYFD